MSVSATDLVLYECANAPAEDDTSSTCGGAITANVVDGTLDEIFNTIAGNTSGGSDKTRYAKVFYKNTNSADDLTDTKIWISTAPPSGHSWAIGTGSSADICTQGTAPAGVSFTSQDGSEGNAITVGTLGANSSIGVWMRVTVTAGTAAYSSVTASMSIFGNTA